jgi:hypothetical protein
VQERLGILDPANDGYVLAPHAGHAARGGVRGRCNAGYPRRFPQRKRRDVAIRYVPS